MSFSKYHLQGGVLVQSYFLLLLSAVYFVLASAAGASAGRAIYLFIAIGIFIWGFQGYSRQKIKSKRAIEEKKRMSEASFKAIPHTHYILTDDYLSALLINEETDTLSIASKEELDEKMKRKDFRFNQIIEVAIVEDKKVLSHITKNGGLSGSLLKGKEDKKNDEDEEDTVTQLSIKMVVDDFSKPVVEYVFMENSRPMSKDDEEYKDVLKLCEQWHQMISVIIKRHEKERTLVRNWE